MLQKGISARAARRDQGGASPWLCLKTTLGYWGSGPHPDFDVLFFPVIETGEGQHVAVAIKQDSAQTRSSDF